MPLVINILGGGHSDAYQYSWTKQFQETRCVPAAGQHVPGLITMRKNWQTEFHQCFTFHILYVKSCEDIIVSTYLHIICCIIEQYNSRISETLAAYTICMWVHT